MGFEWLANSATQMDVLCVAGPYDYTPSGEGRLDWHVNFADPQLFGFYGDRLLAQDELQVAEHPSLRETLIADG